MKTPAIEPKVMAIIKKTMLSEEFLNKTAKFTKSFYKCMAEVEQQTKAQVLADVEKIIDNHLKTCSDGYCIEIIKQKLAELRGVE